MLDADVLGSAFDAAQKTYGKDRFSEAEVLEMATRAVTPGLRKTWCRIFGLSKELTAQVLAEIDRITTDYRSRILQGQ